MATKRMLVDATHPEETRVAIVDGQKLDDLDFELSNRKMLKGNIYLAKVIRIEPSLQAAFVEYGGNRHGFLAFSEIHPDYYRIPVGDRSEDEEEEDDLADAPIITEGPGKAAFADNGGGANETEADQAPQASMSWAEESGAPETSDPLPAFGPTFGDDNTNNSLIRNFSDAPPPPAADAAENEISLTVPDESVEVVGGEAADQAPERFVRPRRPNYKIQEVIKRRQVMLIQVVKEERGNKGAALTTYLSLAGRYCVLMPNTAHGGGVSRKITNHQDRRRMKEILDQLDVAEGMGVILRTAGMEQSIADIQRDLDYLLRLWNSIREQTLQSSAPALIYEEANLIKRSLRDLYGNDISEVLVAGTEGYNRAREFMRTMVPDAVDNVKLYEDTSVPLFFRYHVESQIDALHSPVVQLRSGGYLVINPTEALVSIDVNSGRATRERHIEETALKTNLEAAEESARQLRLRDLAGLVVIDFIDMEDGRNNAAVERRLKESMRSDRARLQIGRISHFGLMELSRQRLRPSLLETNFEKCPHCAGLGYVRATDSAALSVLRGLEEEGIKNRGQDFAVTLATKVAVYILNQKQEMLAEIQTRYGIRALFNCDENLSPSTYTIERSKTRRDQSDGPAVNTADVMASAEDRDISADTSVPDFRDESRPADEYKKPGGRRGGRPPRGPRPPHSNNDRPRRVHAESAPAPSPDNNETKTPDIQPHGPVGDDQAADGDNEGDPRRRRRGRRGGRRRSRHHGGDRFEGREDRPAGSGSDWQEGAAAPAASPHEMPFQAAPRGPSRPMPPAIPLSIHELDTTPREANTSSPSYEMVNQLPDQPKAGWWRRLTGKP